MSKKKSRKKQQFKYGQAQQKPAPAVVGGETGVERPALQAMQPSKGQAKQSQALAGVDDFSYVRQDLIRVASFAALCAGIELVVWLLFRHTGLGTKIYSLFTI